MCADNVCMAQAIELPKTLEEAHALIRDLARHNEELDATNREQASFIAELRTENELLKHRLDLHAQRLFGKKSEHLDEAQLKLAFEALQAEDPESDAADEIPIPAHTRRRRKGHGRAKFSDDIPRERVEIERNVGITAARLAHEYDWTDHRM